MFDRFVRVCRLSADCFRIVRFAAKDNYSKKREKKLFLFTVYFASNQTVHGLSCPGPVGRCVSLLSIQSIGYKIKMKNPDFIVFFFPDFRRRKEEVYRVLSGQQSHVEETGCFSCTTLNAPLSRCVTILKERGNTILSEKFQ